MTVFLLCGIPRKPTYEFDFLTLWKDAIRGPVDHIELIFVDTELLSYYLTYKTGHARFGPRSFHEWERVYEMEWYEIPMTVAQETSLRSFCALQASKENVFISARRMILSALPFAENIKFIRFIFDIVEPEMSEDQEGIEQADAFFQEEESEGNRYHFCASLILEALQKAGFLLNVTDIYKCTSSDVLELVIRHCHASRRKTAPVPIREGDGFDSQLDSTMPRSRWWKTRL